MDKPRVVLVGGSTSLTAALVAALTSSVHVTVVASEEIGLASEPAVPLAPCDQFLVADMPELRVSHTGYGPPRLGKKGKVRRW
jgi:hypothetical protein